MIHPSYVELMQVVNNDQTEIGEEPVINSRYSIVIATAKRARQIIGGDEPMIAKSGGRKPLSVAVQELYEGKVKIVGEDDTIEEITDKVRMAEIKDSRDTDTSGMLETEDMTEMPELSDMSDMIEMPETDADESDQWNQRMSQLPEDSQAEPENTTRANYSQIG